MAQITKATLWRSVIKNTAQLRRIHFVFLFFLFSQILYSLADFLGHGLELILTRIYYFQCLLEFLQNFPFLLALLIVEVLAEGSRSNCVPKPVLLGHRTHERPCRKGRLLLLPANVHLLLVFNILIIINLITCSANNLLCRHRIPGLIRRRHPHRPNITLAQMIIQDIIGPLWWTGIEAGIGHRLYNHAIAVSASILLNRLTLPARYLLVRWCFYAHLRRQRRVRVRLEGVAWLQEVLLSLTGQSRGNAIDLLGELLLLQLLVWLLRYLHVGHLLHVLQLL